jgi:hypothetical protein
MLRDQPLDVTITQVGECVAQLGLWQIDAANQLQPLAAIGYQH